MVGSFWVVNIAFLYIAVICLAIGSGLGKALSGYFRFPAVNITRLIVTGIIALTVAVGWLSIFVRIGAAVHIAVIVIAVLSAYYSRRELAGIFKSVRLRLPEAAAIGCVVLIIAYAASRGAFHTDTGIYHAAAIRQYEEYGILRGAANLQPHYAYNSSYLGFASLFTLSFVLPNALHTTTGFLMLLFLIDALVYLSRFKTHVNHYADAVKAAMIMYIMMNYTGCISPATDYAVNLMTGYFISEWAGLSGEGTDDDVYGILSVYGLFLTTMKLSAAMCVTVVILPLVNYIRKKAFKKIAGFTGLGLACFAFYPIRNVILSGWLFYPFESLDLFDVEWKLPREYSLLDSSQIKVWGRCLFDVDKLDWPVNRWFPVWWEAQEHYDQMLIYAVLIGFASIILTAVIRRRTRPYVLVMFMMIAANLAVWFFTAPFVRYGLIFLLTVPMLAAAGLMDLRDSFGIGRIAIIALIGICYCSRIDHYIMDDLVFVKHNLAEPYYITQKPFDDPETGHIELGDSGITVSYPLTDDEINSYYDPPSTCYLWMLERCEPIGYTVRDGFKGKS